jgi:ethanolamine utilization protein EutA
MFDELRERFQHDWDFDHDHEDFEDEDWSPPTSKNDFYYADNIELTTVGIDIGSSTSHLMFSRLHLQRLGQFLSSRYVVVNREALYRSEILLTPYRSDNTIDAESLGNFIATAYQESGLSPDDIDSGAIILTGEAIKRSNARAIADLFATQAGKFVCASAGHNLEAILAANGSGGVALSRDPAQTVLNIDVGGGTSKFALISNGKVLETAAINVGGRLVATDEDRKVTRVEHAAHMVADSIGVDLKINEPLSRETEEKLADRLAECIFELANRQKLSPLAQELMLTPELTIDLPVDLVTFSGGVSEYIYEREDTDYGDLALSLAASVRKRIADGRLPAAMKSTDERIRATVIGASQFTVQVSGNTISISDESVLPFHNLQVIYPHLPEREDVTPDEVLESIQRAFQRFDIVEGDVLVALAIDWAGTPRYPLLRNIAEGIAKGLANTIATKQPLVLVFANDFGKLIGDIMREEFGVQGQIISIDSIVLQEFDYIDVGEVIRPAFVVPVVVKSLVFPEIVTADAAEVAEAYSGAKQ